MQALRRDPEVFGDPVPGTVDEPGVLLSGVHYLRKVVAGLPNSRPDWYFDVSEQGEGLADTGVHLVDRVHEMLFPDQPLDWRQDIEILAASRWPTAVSLPQFHELTGEGIWLAGRAGRRYASRALPRHPLPARGAAGPRRTLSAGAIRPA